MNGKKRPTRDTLLKKPTAGQDMDAYLSGLSIFDHWSNHERETARQILSNNIINEKLAKLVEEYGAQEMALWIGEAICLPEKFEKLIVRRRKHDLQTQATTALEDMARFRRGLAKNNDFITDAVTFTGSGTARPLQNLTDQLDRLQAALTGFKSILDLLQVPQHSRKTNVASARLCFFVRELHLRIVEIAGRPHYSLIAILAKVCLNLPEEPSVDQLKLICRQRKKRAETR